MNRMKTFIVPATLTALLAWAGHAIGGTVGLWLALVIAAAMIAGAWWFSDKLILRMHHAREVSRAECPELHAIVETLAARAGLPVPRLYIIPEDAPNAFATGRDPRHGVVVVTEGLLRTLDRREVAAVVAHELGHIKHRDTLIMAVAAAFAGALGLLAGAAMWRTLFGRHGDSGAQGSSHPFGGLPGVIITPLAGLLVQMSISRRREFLADESSARYSGAPHALASALRKIAAAAERVPMRFGSPATAHLFIYNALHSGTLTSLFSTHPRVSERIARLMRWRPVGRSRRDPGRNRRVFSIARDNW
jgi:heat shock protein HtpX